MTTYGLTSTGFVPKTQNIVRGEINAALQAVFGLSIDVSSSSVLGQLVGIVAEREGSLWDLAQQVNASQDPNQAVSTALDALAALTGTFRTPASSSTVTLTLTGTPTTVVGSGSQAKTVSTGVLFATTSGATITALAPWTALSGYIAGTRVTNGGNAYQCTIAGTSAASGGPTTTATDIVDGTVHWTFLGAGTGAIDAAAASVPTGPIVGVARDIASIQTPVGGWSAVINLVDASVGANVMTDGALRLLRVAELAASGVATQNAIRAALLQVIGVTSATVFVNNTDAVNSDGMPPHSVEALVQGGADQLVLNCLFASVAAGIAYQASGAGAVVGTVVDSTGTAQTVKFSRPAPILIYDDITLIEDPTTYPSGGNALVQAAVVAYGTAQACGKDAVASSIGASAFGVAGVIDVTQTLVYTDVIGTPVAWTALTPYVATVGARSVVTNDGGRTYICITGGNSAASGGPTGVATDITDGTVHWRFLGATVPVTTRQLAVHDTSRINVHSSSGTP